jgi:serine/threonine-protein kinase
MNRSSAFFGGLLGLLVALDAGHAAAADATASDKASAEALFDEGLRAMKEGRFTEACPKLENSQRIDPGVGTLLYLGECYEKLGRTASAWATFREAASEAEASGQIKRAKAARDRIAKLEPQLAYLTIEVAEATRDMPGLRLRRDGTDTGLGIIGAAVPADPGTTKIDVTATDHESFSVTVRVQPSAHQTVLIPTLAPAPQGPRPVAAAAVVAAPPPAPPPAASATPPPPAPAADDNPGGTQRVIGLILAGGGLVGVGLGTYFGLSAIAKEERADEKCSPTLCQEAADFENSDAAQSAATASTVSFAIGGGLIAAGAVIYFTAPSKASSVSLSPVVGPGFAGLSLGGRL